LSVIILRGLQGCFLVSSGGASNEASVSTKAESLVSASCRSAGEVDASSVPLLQNVGTAESPFPACLNGAHLVAEMLPCCAAGPAW
jgi:hypothetical protein